MMKSCWQLPNVVGATATPIVRRQPARGFTLVEVMVALLIVGLALPALMFQLGTQLSATGTLQAQMTATWVAQNELALLRLQAAAGNAEVSAFREGQSDMANQLWNWQVEAVATPVPDFYRIDVAVSHASRPYESLVRLTDYLWLNTQGAQL